MGGVANVSVVVCCLAALASVAPAASSAPDAGQMLRENAPPIPAPQPRQPVIEAPAEKRHTLPATGIRVPVSGFVYSGNTVFTAAELDQIMAPVVGGEPTLAELEQAVDRITQAYRAKGYFLATAVIPPQSLAPGEPVRIEILEGRLEEIDLKTTPADTRTPKGLLERYRTRIAVGRPVNSDELTETALLLNELPSLRTRIVFEPGRETGGTRATLEVSEGAPYRFSLFSDNYGNYATGYYRAGAGLELYSPLRLGDQLALRAHSSTSGDTQGVATSWSLPVSSSGTRVILGHSWVRYRLGRSFTSLDAHGDAHGFSLTTVQPLVRRADLLVNALFAVEGRLLDDRIAGAGSNKRHTVGAQAGLHLYAADGLLRGGSTGFSVTYTGGTLGFDDGAARAQDQDGAAGLHTAGGYHKVSGSLSRTQTIYGDLSLFAGISGQWCSGNLDSVEQLAMGGPYAVRAYPTGDASADRGMVTTAELRYLLPPLGPVPGRVQVAGLFDHGYAVMNARPLSSTGRNIRHLYGAGFGMNWQWHELAELKTSVAWPLGDPPATDSAGGRGPTVYVQAVLYY